MGWVLNIRGTNGSGKSHLVRSMLPTPEYRPNVNLARYDSPTKRYPDRKNVVPGYVLSERDLGLFGVVGSYETPTGGLDGVPTFAAQIASCAQLLNDNECCTVLAEGVLASTVFGAWGAFADDLSRLSRHRMAFLYMSTPVDVCLMRITERQIKAGRIRDINEQLVRDKVRAVAATRERALAAGHAVFDLPFGLERVALTGIMRGDMESYRGN